MSYIQFLQPSLSDGTSWISYIINDFYHLKINIANCQTSATQNPFRELTLIPHLLWIPKVLIRQISLARPCIFWESIIFIGKTTMFWLFCLWR